MKRNTGLVPSPDDLGEAVIPSPDYETLYSLYIPTHSEDVSWDEFAARGCMIVDTARDLFLLLGHLAIWGKPRFGHDLTQRKWELKCGAAWGCDRSTVNKAITVARSKALIPRDVPASKAYAVLSVTSSDDEAGELFDVVIREGWSNQDIYHHAALKREGLIDGWYRLRLILSGNVLYSQNGDERAEIVRFGDNGGLAKAGLRLLQLRGRF
jgi:hypothetical protein